ncbi:DUF4132 domain-containing protein [Actinomadura macrotermitis]|uniref:DUF4132 domain-containing protein n=1 Tax=Actinomadura macrotermitis TaxID=2585200 RepID=A0A7K0C8A5_9ACTN|nr:DUF4132 domain-containing protein [Actinomadura macrotermitis]MQY09342.1 hypothetical protein [Actinomadura macrotermitis]
MDEDSLVIPKAWRRLLYARRGGVPVPAVRVDASAVESVRADVARRRERIERILGHPRSEPEVAAAIRRYLAGDADPLGAAAVAQILMRELYLREGAFDRFADTWHAEHGLPFAACALAELGRPVYQWGYSAEEEGYWIRYRVPGDDFATCWLARSALRRVRALLAAADDAEYDEAVQALSGKRGTLLQRVLTCHLVPARQDWLDDCLAELPGDHRVLRWMLFCSVGSPRQLPAFSGAGWGEDDLGILASAMEGVGTALVPLLVDGLGTYQRSDDRKRLLDVLAVLPSDEAFGALLERDGEKHVRPALMAAMRRFPKRAHRMLSAAGSGLAAELERKEEVREQAGRLPEVLVRPPWTRRRVPRERVVIEGLVPSAERAVVWAPGERERWLLDERYLQLGEDVLQRFRSGRIGDWDAVVILLHAPLEVVRPLLAIWTPRNTEVVLRHAEQLAARFGLDVLPLLLYVAEDRPASGVKALLPFLDARVAALMAGWAGRRKPARKIAAAWLDRHGLAAARLLVPVVLGRADRPAEDALLRIAERHGPGGVVEAAREYGDEAAAAIAGLLTADPLERLPARIPKIGDWADPALLPRVRLRTGGTLPAEAAGHVLTMLAFSAPGERYAGLGIVREVCDPASLAEFGWAAFERWRAAGAPTRDGWALTGLGVLGDDGTVRRLTPLIMAWPGEGRHRAAVTGLEVLAEIGTEFALAHLHRVFQKTRFRALRDHAGVMIDQIAADLELTPDELADRLVPDFGLDGLVLDYGPRRFTVGFDEQLRPYVRDEAGKLRKVLPKPGAKDDPDLASAALQRFTALKKDVRGVAADQIRRLETAMVKERRWTAADFRRFLVEHPLMRNLARRLVWITDDGTAFRVAEDGTLADVHDDLFTLPEAATVAVAHPLHLDVPAWTQLFADYEILQPFPQLGRPVFALGEDEDVYERLAGFTVRPVPFGRLLGLTRRGWRHGDPQDAGIVSEMVRDLPGGTRAVIGVDPGYPIGARDADAEHRIGVTVLGSPGPVALSELIADVAALAGEDPLR